MKITKTFVSIFLATFLVGYASVLTNKQETKLFELSETNSKKISASQVEKIAELEMVEEINGRNDEEKYPFKIKLLVTGSSFHGDEVKAKSGEIWLGLFKENDEYYLRSTKLKVRHVYDEIVDDEDKKAKTGKEVIVDGKNQPIYLLKNANAIREGKITTLFQGLSWKDVFDDKESDIAPDDMLTTLKKNFSRTFEINEKKYKLKTIEAKNEKGERIGALILESDGVRQVLHTANVDDFFDLGHLYWVGDLDRDGKPDFYFDLFEHYNVMNRVLFLSSQAEKGKLLKKVAYFRTTGC